MLKLLISHVSETSLIVFHPFNTDLLTCPPGFDHGVNYSDNLDGKKPGVIKVEDLLTLEEDDLWLEEDKKNDDKNESDKVFMIISDQ